MTFTLRSVTWPAAPSRRATTSRGASGGPRTRQPSSEAPRAGPTAAEPLAAPSRGAALHALRLLSVRNVHTRTVPPGEPRCHGLPARSPKRPRRDGYRPLRDAPDSGSGGVFGLV